MLPWSTLDPCSDHACSISTATCDNPAMSSTTTSYCMKQSSSSASPSTGIQEVTRFLCDEMLHGLGRWLRAAGYNTVIAAGGIRDRELTARCANEDRVLLTRDRHLATVVAGTAPVVLLPGGGIDEAARALRIALDIDWQYAPFTRCIVDNRLLEMAPPDLALRVPERSRVAGGPLRVCRECGRLYWPGSHVRRMQRRLAAWQEETPPSTS